LKNRLLSKLYLSARLRCAEKLAFQSLKHKPYRDAGNK